MTVLIAYATYHGSTRGVADRIAQRLGEAGLDTELRPVGGVVDLGSYDAVVLGSAVHSQRWLPEADRFVAQHGAELADRPTWLFSVCSIGDSSTVFVPVVGRLLMRIRGESDEIAGFRTLVEPVDHRHFAGVIRPTHWPLPFRPIYRLLGGRYGDQRDWDDIDEWAWGIAGELVGARSETSKPREG